MAQMWVLVVYASVNYNALGATCTVGNINEVSSLPLLTKKLVTRADMRSPNEATRVSFHTKYQIKEGAALF